MTWTVEQITARGGARVYRTTWKGEQATIAGGRLIEPGEVVDLPSVTTVLNVLGKYDIELWKQRMVCVGTASDKSLQQMALTGDKKVIQQAADQALELGKQAANTGTAYHAVAERISTAADAFDIAAELRPWAERFGRLLDDHGIVIKQREITVLNLTHLYAGQVDVFVLHEQMKRIGDTKTGSAGFRDQAYQLAAYANAEYAFVDGELVPLPADIDKDTGLILHVPAEGDEAHLLAMPLADAWEAFKACVTIKHVQARMPKYVATPVEPTHRFSDTYVEWIRNRLAEHKADNPAIVTMFQAWRLAAFGDRPSSELTTDELEACLTALCDLEAREQVPFPSATYPHPHGPRISVETAEAIQARIDALPQWCRTEVLAQKGKLPTVDQWRVVDAEEFEQVLGPAESAAASLRESISTLVDSVREPGLWIYIAKATTSLHPDEWSWTEFEVASRMADAFAAGFVIVNEDATGVTTLPTIVDRLVDIHGSKSDVTKFIREQVAELGLDIPVPRALAEACQDVRLVALAA